MGRLTMKKAWNCSLSEIGAPLETLTTNKHSPSHSVSVCAYYSCGNL